MTERWVAFILFVLSIGEISWLNRWRVRPHVAGYLTTRDLRPNTRITKDHWLLERGAQPADAWSMPKSEDLVGRYALQFIGRNTPLMPEMLSDTPRLPTVAGTVLLPFGSENLGAAAVLLNAGASVYICDEANQTCPGGPYEVEAVVGKSEAPSALIRVQRSQADELRKISQPKLRLAGLP